MSDYHASESMETPNSDTWWNLLRAKRALLVLDLVESVRLMQRQESHVIRAWQQFVREIRFTVVPLHSGRLVKSLGDGLLLEFENVHDAVAAAQSARALMLRQNEGQGPPDLRLHLRMGLHVADIVLDELDVYGAGVNLAARLAGLAGPDEIVISSEVRDVLIPGTDPEVEDLGECWLKHYDEPVRAYRLGVRVPDPEGAALDRTDLRPVLAILPFEGPAGDVRLSCLGELFSTEVQALILPNATLKVISRPSSVAAATRGLALPELHRVLQADFILTGSIAGDNDCLRVAVVLREARTGELLWEREICATVAELHTPEGEAAKVVAEAVAHFVLSSQMQMARLLPLPNLHAHALLLGGVALMHRFCRRDFQRARELLHALRERAPRHGLPCAWLARWHLFAVIQGWSMDVKSDTQCAEDMARRALDCDPESSLAMTIAGSVQLQLRHDIVQAEALYGRALEVNPQESLAWLLLGTALGFRGSGEQAVRHSETAMSLSPIDPMRFFYQVHAAATTLAAGHYERSIELAKSAIRLNRQHTSTYRALAIAQSLSGQIDDARETVQRLLGLEPGYTVQTFLQRSPGAKFGQGETFAQALRDAGLPEGV